MLENADLSTNHKITHVTAHTNAEWHVKHLKRSGIDQIAFMHIGKTGGISICRELMNRFDHDAIFQFGLPQLCDFESLQLETKKLVAGHFSYNQLKYLSPNRFLFSMLRDPVDRVLSAYYFTRNYPRETNEFNRTIIESAKQHSLSEFINLDHPDVQMMVRNQQTYTFASDWTVDRTGDEESILEKALLNFESFYFVGLYEFYNSSLKYLSYKCGFAPWPSKNIINKTSTRKRVEEVPADVVENIKSLNRLDLELYRVCRAKFQAQICDSFEARALDQCAALREEYSILNAGPFSHSFESALDGMGWHQREYHRGKHFRWMGPDTDATIWLPIDRTEDRIVCVHLFGWMSADFIDGLRLFTGNSECPRTEFSKLEHDDAARCRYIEWVLPKAPQANKTDAGMLRLKVQAVLPLPQPVGPNPAERYGSVAVHRIDVI